MSTKIMILLSHKQVVLNEFHFYSFQAPEKACVKDSDCDTSNCEYCLSNGHCSEFDSEYCDSFPCGVGDGDCDSKGCSVGLGCGNNNFLEYHPLLSHCASGTTQVAEVCINIGI